MVYSLCLDQGNSGTKAGIFSEYDLISVVSLKNNDATAVVQLIDKYFIEKCILCSVVVVENDFLSAIKRKVRVFIELTDKTPIPINNLYKSPETLGKDRLAAVVGVTQLTPSKDVLVVDAGTAITYDFVDAGGNYWGGNIAPGVDMRLKSLHHFTNKLPLIKADKSEVFLGFDTASAILSGVLYGVEFEINGYINQLKIKYPELLTFLTGGSSFYFEEKLKSAIFAEKNLVLIGLNRILKHNVKE